MTWVLLLACACSTQTSFDMAYSTQIRSAYAGLVNEWHVDVRDVPEVGSHWTDIQELELTDVECEVGPPAQANAATSATLTVKLRREGAPLSGEQDLPVVSTRVAPLSGQIALQPIDPAAKSFLREQVNPTTTHPRTPGFYVSLWADPDAAIDVPIAIRFRFRATY